MADGKAGPSWTLISIRTAFLRDSADKASVRAEQLRDLGALVRPLLGFRATNRLETRFRGEPAKVWEHLDRLEGTLREYHLYLDSCAEVLARIATRERVGSRPTTIGITLEPR
jgi:hypothetical protein